MDIWKEISKDLNFSYAISEITNWNDWPKAMTEGNGDVGIQSLIWTEERNRAFDFTPPFQVADVQLRPDSDAS